MSAYTSAQRAVAAETHDFWLIKPGSSKIITYACMGSEDGETSFVPTVRGDHDEAGGPGQHHNARRDFILHGCHIDVWALPHLKQLEGIYWEMTDHTSPYRHVWPALSAAMTIKEAVTVLVVHYEQSAQQARDIERRTVLANFWMSEFEGKSR